MTQSIPKMPLYEQDMVLWCADMVAKLRAGDLVGLDIEHLIEEIEGLANRDKNEVESRLDILLSHVLKRLYVDSAYDYRGWEITIREQQKQLRRLLKQSPSLKNYLAEVFDEVWQDVLTDVHKAYPKTMFPDEWPFSRDVDRLLSNEFWQQEA
jgi:hypothetical protein